MREETDGMSKRNDLVRDKEKQWGERKRNQMTVCVCERRRGTIADDGYN